MIHFYTTTKIRVSLMHTKPDWTTALNTGVAPLTHKYATGSLKAAKHVGCEAAGLFIFESAVP